MNTSLRTKLLLWNALFFVCVTVAFGALQIWTGERATMRMLDDFLISRTRDFARRPAPGPMDRPPQGSALDPRRPRFFNRDGQPIGPDDVVPWSQELLTKSLSGLTATGNVTLDFVQYRVASVPISRPGGDEEVVQIAQETESLAIARRAQWVALLSALPLVALASAAIGWLLSRLVLRPVGLLTRVTEHVAQDTRARDRMPINGTDEMNRLSVAFNTMTDRLQDSLERQARFTSDAAHELRTPLTSISLAAENGLHSDATSEEMRRALTVVDRSAKSMRKLTEVLLALSRFDTERQELALQEVELGSVLQSAVQAVGLSGDPRVRIQGEGRATVNEDAVHQVATNLLENAAAYTPPGGIITIQIKNAEFEIRDTGPGISAEHLPHLFDRFYRADPSRVRETGGYGLGLAIAKTLCDAQCATIDVQSEMGVGTTFSVKFSGDSQNS